MKHKKKLKHKLKGKSLMTHMPNGVKGGAELCSEKKMPSGKGKA